MTRRWTVTLWRSLPSLALAGALSLMAAACGGDDDASGSAGPPPAEPSGSATVGGSAQTAAVTIEGTQGSRVVVPAGALDQPVTVRIAADSTGMPALPPGLNAAGTVYAVTPHGTEFAESVTVSVPAPAVALAARQRLLLAKADPGGEWTLLLDTAHRDGRLTARVHSLSFFVPVVVGFAVPTGLLPPPPYEPTSFSVDCAGEICSALPARDARVTTTVQANGGSVPDFCVPGTEQLNVSQVTAVPGTIQVQRHPLPWAGGTVEVLLPSSTTRWARFAPNLTCAYVGGGSVSASWQAFSLQEVRFKTSSYARGSDVRIEAQPPVVGSAVAGGWAVAETTVFGGAHEPSFVSGRDPYVDYVPPTATNRAVVTWERSDDGGASWRQVATSYQDEAERIPVPSMGATYVSYWRVRHAYRAEATPSVSFRVQACIDVRVLVGTEVRSEARCHRSAATSATVLQQGSPITFTTLPRAQLVLAGQTATLTAAATALPAPTLQWQTRPAGSSGAWSDVSTGQGGTTGQYTTPVLTLADNGTQYRVVATSGGTSEASPPVTVSVSDAPVAPQITAELSAIRALRGGDATFAVGVRGTEPLSYQWRFNGNVVAGQNAPVLNLQSIQAGGTVSVTVSNGAGSATSREVSLTVSDGVAPPIAPVSIVGQPQDTRVAYGQSLILAVQATGGGQLHYRWQYHGRDIAFAPAADSPVLVLPNVSGAESGLYRVIVSNAAGSVTSNEVTVTTFNPGPSFVPLAIDTQPVGLSLNPGQTATFAVVARGMGTLRYQWYREGVAIAGATAPVLTVGAVSAADAGNYTVDVTDQNGTQVSDAAALVVVPAPGAPGYGVQTFQVDAVEGDTPFIEMRTFPTPAARCLWLKNGAVVPGATSCIGLTLAAVTAADHGSVYTSVAYNQAGVAIGGPALLRVFAPAAPAIVTQPADASTTEGGTASFFAAASGQPAPGLDWSVNGTTLSQAAGATFTAGTCTGLSVYAGISMRLHNLSAGCNGAQVVFLATNRLGTATSRTATLTVAAAVPAGALTATQVVAGYEWSVVLRPDRSVWGWGGLHKTDGTVVVSNLAPADQARRPVQLYPAVLTDVRQIAGWYDGFWALRGEPGSAASRVLHWGNARSANDGRGSDGAGNLGPIPQSRVNAAPVEMLERRTVAGSLQAAPVDRVCSLAATSDRVLMIRALDAFGTPTDCAAGSAKTVWAAGTLTQFGADAVGVVVPVQGLPAGIPARLIAAQHGAQSSSGPILVLMADGSLHGWGTNIGNQFGLPLPANTGHLGSSAAPQALPGSWGTARHAAFTYVGLIVGRSDGSAMVSGRNDGGELGLGPQASGTVNDGPLPLLAAAGVPLDGVEALASTQAQVSLALRQGRILAWGAASQPLQGGSTVRIDYPRQLPASGDGWRALSAGHLHALAIAANGAVHAWGNGLRGALGDGVDGSAAPAPTLVSLP